MNSVSRAPMHVCVKRFVSLKHVSSYRINVQHTLHLPHVHTLASLPKAVSNNLGHVSLVSLHKSTSMQVSICHTVKEGEACGIL